MIGKLRLRLILASIFSLFLVLSVIIGGAGIMNYQHLVSDADRTLSLLMENDGQFPEIRTTTSGKQSSHRNLLPKKDGQMSPELPFESRFFTVTMDENGTVTSANTDRIMAVDNDTAASYGQTVVSGNHSNHSSGFLQDYRYMLQTDDTGTTVIFLDCGRTLDNFRNFLLTIIGVSLAGLLAVLLLLILLSQRIVRPFAESYAKQKRFITDAGHELKTPLTIIDADTEILEMDFGENEWLSDIQSQTRRLADLTGQLVLLARMEEEQPALQMIDFPLSDLAEETVDDFQALARTNGKTLTRKIDPLLTIHGDEAAIRRLITILLDNAMKYSDEKGRITLTLEKQKQNAVLKVSNTVDQIDPDSLSSLFDRFYRTDASRNSRTGGFGLGLSIAAATVRAHKGKIRAATEDGKSLNIVVTLPVS